LIVNDRRYFHIMPETMKVIVDSMLDPLADQNGLLNLEQFK